MEKRKKLLIKVLTKLKPYRNLAEGIMALIKSNYVDENTINGVVNAIAKALKKTKNKQEKSKLQQGMEIVKRLKKKEEKERENEDADQELEIMIKDI